MMVIDMVMKNEKNGEGEPLVGCDAVVVALGEPSELTVYQKSTALFVRFKRSSCNYMHVELVTWV